MNPDLLLSDKFVEFSSKIAALHDKKKTLSIEIKKLIEEHKEKIKALEEQAQSLMQEFQTQSTTPAPNQTVKKA